MDEVVCKHRCTFCGKQYHRDSTLPWLAGNYCKGELETKENGRIDIVSWEVIWGIHKAQHKRSMATKNKYDRLEYLLQNEYKV